MFSSSTTSLKNSSDNFNGDILGLAFAFFGLGASDTVISVAGLGANSGAGLEVYSGAGFSAGLGAGSCIGLGVASCAVSDASSGVRVLS